MNGFDDLAIRDRAAWHERTGTLLLADLHLGRVRRSPIELPLGERRDLLDRLNGHIEAVGPERVVIVGDLLCGFGHLPHGVSRSVQEIRETVEEAGARFTVVAGNHDGALDEVPGTEEETAIELDPNTIVHHGHEVPATSADRYVIGHEHPAITIEGDRRPCFLRCPDQYDGANVFVLPAFSRVAPGTPVNGLGADDVMSPLIVDIEACRPVVPTAEEPLPFPALGELRAHL
ncbi:MAG: metallophosphoesterase [Halodesulfurarchaeum sp.]